MRNVLQNLLTVSSCFGMINALASPMDRGRPDRNNNNQRGVKIWHSEKGDTRRIQISVGLRFNPGDPLYRWFEGLDRGPEEVSYEFALNLVNNHLSGQLGWDAEQYRYLALRSGFDGADWNRGNVGILIEVSLAIGTTPDANLLSTHNHHRHYPCLSSGDRHLMPLRASFRKALFATQSQFTMHFALTRTIIFRRKFHSRI